LAVISALEVGTNNSKTLPSAETNEIGMSSIAAFLTLTGFVDTNYGSARRIFGTFFRCFGNNSL